MGIKVTIKKNDNNSFAYYINGVELGTENDLIHSQSNKSAYHS